MAANLEILDEELATLVKNTDDSKEWAEVEHFDEIQKWLVQAENHEEHNTQQQISKSIIQVLPDISQVSKTHQNEDKHAKDNEPGDTAESMDNDQENDYGKEKIYIDQTVQEKILNFIKSKRSLNTKI